MTEKSDLLGIDLQEELTAIRQHKTGKDILRTRKLENPSDAATIRHKLRLTQGSILSPDGRISANAA